MKEVNPVSLEVIGNMLISIAEQMGGILTKTAFSSNIKERKDLSVAIFNEKGKLLALAQHIPLHFSSLSSAVEEVANKWSLEDIHEGDVFIANDPYSGGGSHLQDVVLVKPVFYKRKLIAFVANLGHHADRSHRGKSVYDEGLRIPAVKLYNKGVLVKDIYNLILLNYQLKKEREGDFRAQLITNKLGENKIIELVNELGKKLFLEFCDEWMKYGMRKARAKINHLPDGIYEFEDYLDDDGYDTTNIIIRVAIKIKGNQIEFDFNGSSPQVDGPYNCVKSALLATVYYCVKSLLDPSIPANSGFFDSIKVSAPLGTIVNAVEPGAANDRETTVQRIADAIFGAYSKIDPSKVIAAGNGACSFYCFNGINTITNKPYSYLETIGGGSGARSNKDGLDAVQVHLTNTSNLPVEALEMEFPFRVEKYELVQDSGGAGKFRGGLSIKRAIKILDNSQKTSLVASTERAKFQPWGLFGGKSGSNSNLSVIRNGKKINTKVKLQGMPLKPGDIIEMKTAGGGGYGKPTERDLLSIKKDLEEGKVSKIATKQDYGITNTQ